MVAKKKKVSKKALIAKGAALEKLVSSSVDQLAAAAENVSKAVVTRSGESKKLLAENKRLNKKLAALAKRKKAAEKKLRATPDAANRKVLASVGKELVSIKKLVQKNKVEKVTLAEELATLKLSHKRASAYAKALATADKQLNKPVKKKKRRKVAKSKTANVDTNLAINDSEAGRM